MTEAAAVSQAHQTVVTTSVTEVQNLSDYLLADMTTNVYLLFKEHKFENLESVVFAHDAGKHGVKELKGFNPMHATKDGERGILTKNLQNILDKIQDICTSCIRVGSADDLDKCYAAMAKTVEGQFRLNNWFAGVSAFDTATETPTTNVPAEFAPKVFSILNKVIVNSDAEQRVTYVNNIVVTLNADPRASGFNSILAYAGNALMKIRNKVDKDRKYTLFVGVVDNSNRIARVLTGMPASENQNMENDDEINYMVLNNDHFEEQTFVYAHAHNKVGPVAEQRKTRDSVMGRDFYLYAKV